MGFMIGGVVAILIGLSLSVYCSNTLSRYNSSDNNSHINGFLPTILESEDSLAVINEY